MLKNTKLLLLAIAVLLVPFALATTLNLEPVVDQISPYDTAKFKLTITDVNFSDKFIVSYGDLDWAVETDPLTDYTTGIFVEAGKSYSTILLAKPLVETEKVFKKHSLEIKVTADKTKEVITSVVNIDVRRDLIKYPLNMKVDLMMPSELIPGKANSIKIKLQNGNLLNITNLNITIKSSLFEKQAMVDLAPKTEKIIDFPITLEKLPPQSDNVTLLIMHTNETVAKITKQYSVASYGKFTSTQSRTEKLLGEERTITFTNNGNSDGTESIMIPAGDSWQRLFSSTNPETNVAIVDNVAYYTQELTLSPTQSGSFTVNTDYKPILYVIIIILVVLIIYFSLRNPITVAKEVSEIDVEEGGITKLSVLIKMKNRSGKELKHVRIIERVPSIARVQIKESETLKPTKTYSYEDGMVMEYNIGKFDAGEIRFVSYHLKTKLAVVGGLRVKPTIVEYEGGKKAFSNPADVYVP